MDDLAVLIEPQIPASAAMRPRCCVSARRPTTSSRTRWNGRSAHGRSAARATCAHGCSRSCATATSKASAAAGASRSAWRRWTRIPTRGPIRSGLGARDVLNGIAALPEEQRSVLLLVAVEDMSYAEVAAVLAVPVGTVCRASAGTGAGCEPFSIWPPRSSPASAEGEMTASDPRPIGEDDLHAFVDGRLDRAAAPASRRGSRQSGGRLRGSPPIGRCGTACGRGSRPWRRSRSLPACASPTLRPRTGCASRAGGRTRRRRRSCSPSAVHPGGSGAAPCRVQARPPNR